jgi:hypothetical protein
MINILGFPFGIMLSSIDHHHNKPPRRQHCPASHNYDAMEIITIIDGDYHNYDAMEIMTRWKCLGRSFLSWLLPAMVVVSNAARPPLLHDIAHLLVSDGS